MKALGIKAALALGLGLGLWTGAASADPDKDESGKGRWRGGYERPYVYGDPYGGYGERRRERRAFKQEYDDGVCKYEFKLEKSGEYKEEVKCRGGRPRRADHPYDYRY